MASLKPLSLTSTVEHLRGVLVGEGKYHAVERAANRQAALAQRTMPMPGLFIIDPTYGQFGRSPNASGGVVMQNQAYEVGCLTVVANYSSVEGSRQGEDAEDLRGLLWDAMLRFMPEPGGNNYDTGQGGLLDFDDQVFIYLDTFRLQRHIRS